MVFRGQWLSGDWAFGHLVELQEPGEFTIPGAEEFGRWSRYRSFRGVRVAGLRGG